MRTTLLIILFCISSAYAQKSLKLMSYNIRYSYGMDKKYDLQRIADVIKKENPDIVGVQEVSNLNMAKKLGELTGMKWIFGPSLGRNNGYGDAILSKFPFEALPNESIPSASESRYQALALDVDVSTVFGRDKKIRFVTTHFDWKDTLGSQYARLATVPMLEEAFFKDCKIPCVLTGDLNATPDSKPLKALYKRGWFFDDNGKLFTIPVDKPKRQIDYVLLRDKSLWKIHSTKVIQEKVASDHLPIVMTVSLKR